MSYDCWLECIRGCGRRHSIFDVVYHCDDCGGLLEVEHDLDALLDRSGDEWKTLFERQLSKPRLNIPGPALRFGLTGGIITGGNKSRPYNYSR